ncbi:cysteine proteinase [Meredithblackwellia eburnea MCA 4105]
MSTHTDKIVSSMPGAEAKGKDIHKLDGLKWLNDEVITFYSVMIVNRSKALFGPESTQTDKTRALVAGLNKDDFVKAWAFNSFFYAKFTGNEGYAGVKRWTRKVDIFNQDVVIVPINCGNMHWVCSAINIKKKRFEYYDSLGSRDNSVFRNLRKYLEAESLDKKKVPIDLKDWEDYWDEELPQQSNSCDCGVFTTQFMESLSRGVEEFDFSQEQMP